MSSCYQFCCKREIIRQEETASSYACTAEIYTFVVIEFNFFSIIFPLIFPRVENRTSHRTCVNLKFVGDVQTVSCTSHYCDISVFNIISDPTQIIFAMVEFTKSANSEMTFPPRVYKNIVA